MKRDHSQSKPKKGERLKFKGFYLQAEKISKCLKGTECFPTNILQSHCRFPGDLFFLKLLCEERREMTIKAILSISFPQSVAYC